MAISRPWGRIRGYPAHQGGGGVWVPLCVGWGRRVEWAVEAGSRTRSQAMCCEVWRWLNSCLAGWNGRARSKLPGWLKWAHMLKVAWLIEMGACAQSERFGDFSPPSCCSYELMKNRSARGDTLLINTFFISFEANAYKTSQKEGKRLLFPDQGTSFLKKRLNVS